jgi:hypothetical protein
VKFLEISYELFRKAIKWSQKIVKNHEKCYFFHLEASYGYFDVILNQVPESKVIPDPELVPEPDPGFLFPSSDLRIRILPELISDPELVPDPKPVLDLEPVPDPQLVFNLVPDPGP